VSAAAGRAPGAAALAAGLALLAALWLGPLPALARVAFAPHMILHLGVTAAAAPLIALGLVRVARASLRLRRPLAVALGAAAVEWAAVWGWHAPALHARAALSDGAFALQQASFLAAGMGVWLTAFADRSRTGAAAGVLAMFLTFMHMAMLGVALALAPRLIYPLWLCGGAFGLDPLDDQRLGGALMAVLGGLPYLIGGLILASRLIGVATEPAGRAAT
jgi:putative membrane protein